MSVACGIVEAGRWVLLLRRCLVVVWVSEDQILRGRRWFSSTTHGLLQQSGEVQTTTEWIGKDNKKMIVGEHFKSCPSACWRTALNYNWVIHLCPGVMWFSAAGAHEEVNTLVSESCQYTQKQEVQKCLKKQLFIVCLILWCVMLLWELTPTSSLQSSGAKSSRVFLQATRRQTIMSHKGQIVDKIR